MRKNHELAVLTPEIPSFVRKRLNEEWHNLGELLSATEELCRWLDRTHLSPEVRKSKDRVRAATEQVRGDS